MPDKGPVISVGLKLDNINEFIKEADERLSNLKVTGLSQSLENEVKSMKKTLADLQTEINNVGHSKLNTTTFSKAQQTILAKVEELETRTSALELGMSTLINTMSRVDGGKFAAQMKDISDVMQQLASNTTNAVTAMSGLPSLPDVSDETKELQEMADAINAVKEAFDKTPKVGKFKTIEEAVEKINEEYDKYLDLQDKIIDAQDAGLGTQEQKKQLLSFQKELVATGDKIQEMMDKAAQAFGDSIYSKKGGPFKESFTGISDNIQQDLDNIQFEIEDKSKEINKQLSKALADVSSDTAKKPVKVVVKPTIDKKFKKDIQNQVDSSSDNLAITISDATLSEGLVKDSAEEIAGTIADTVKSSQNIINDEMNDVGVEAAEAVKDGILSQEEELKKTWVKVFHGISHGSDDAKFKSHKGHDIFFTEQEATAKSYAGASGSVNTAYLDTSKFFNLQGYGFNYSQLPKLGDGIVEESKEAIALYNKIIDDLHVLEKLDDDVLGTNQLNGFIQEFKNKTTGEIVALENSHVSFYKQIKSLSFAEELEKAFDGISGDAKKVLDNFISDLNAYRDFIAKSSGTYGGSTSVRHYEEFLQNSQPGVYSGIHVTDVYDNPSGSGYGNLNDEWVVFDQAMKDVLQAAYAVKGTEKTYTNYQERINKLLDSATSTKIGKLEREIALKTQELNSSYQLLDDPTEDQDYQLQIIEETSKELESLITQKMNLKERLNNMSSYIEQLNTKANETGKYKGFDGILKTLDNLEDLPTEIQELLKVSGMVDNLGNSKMTKVSGGFTNTGVYQNDEITIIERGLEYLPKIESLIPKLSEATKAGISVGEILGTVVDKENGLIYDIQSTVHGSVVTSSDEYLKATDAQIQKLYDDIKKLNDIGLYIDVGGENILYDEKTGFSFIDMMSQITEKNIKYTAPNVKDTIDRFFKNLNENFYNRIYEVVPQLKSPKTSSLKEAEQSTSTNVKKGEQDASISEKKAKELYKEYKKLKQEYDALPNDAADDIMNEKAESVAKAMAALKDGYIEAHNAFDSVSDKYNKGEGAWEDVEKVADVLDAYHIAAKKAGFSIDELNSKINDLGNTTKNVGTEDVSQNAAWSLYKDFKKAKDEYDKLGKDTSTDELKEAWDKFNEPYEKLKEGYVKAKANFDNLKNQFKAGLISQTELDESVDILTAYEVPLNNLGVDLDQLSASGENATESISSLAQAMKESDLEEGPEDSKSVFTAYFNVQELMNDYKDSLESLKKQQQLWHNQDSAFDEDEYNLAKEAVKGYAHELELLGYTFDEVSQEWGKSPAFLAADEAEALLDKESTTAEELIAIFEKLQNEYGAAKEYFGDDAFESGSVKIANQLEKAMDDVHIAIEKAGYEWNSFVGGFIKSDELPFDTAADSGKSLADALDELEDEFVQLGKAEDILADDTSIGNFNKKYADLKESLSNVDDFDDPDLAADIVDTIKSFEEYSKEHNYMWDTITQKWVEVEQKADELADDVKQSLLKALGDDLSPENFNKLQAKIYEDYDQAEMAGMLEWYDGDPYQKQIDALKELGKELGYVYKFIEDGRGGETLGFALDDSVKDTSEELNKIADSIDELNEKAKEKASIEESITSVTDDLGKEAQDFIEISDSAEKAAVSKEDFVTANADVLKSIIDSLKGLKDEGNAFEQINKLLNNLGGSKGSDKLESTVKGLREIITLLSQDVDESSFIKALQRISESGSNLSDIATILKSSKKELLEAKKVFDQINTEDIDDLMKNHAQEIFKNAKKELYALGGDGSQIINISDISKTKDGLLEIVGLVRTADDTLQEFTLHTKDGISMQNVAMNENTSQIAKQMKAYAQAQEYFNKVKAQSENIADEFFFDKNTDPETWEMLINFAKEYADELGNIKSITMQTRQNKAGEALLESFSLNGEKGRATLGPRGMVVASGQDLLNVEELEKSIAKLTTKTKQYHELLKKKGTAGWTSADAAELKKIEDEYSDIVKLVREYSDALGDSTNITETFAAAVNKMTVDYNNMEQSYIDKVSKSLNDAYNNPSNKNQAYTASFNAELEQTIQDVARLQEIINNHGNSKTPWSEEEIEQVKELHSNIDATVMSIKDLGNIEAKSTSIDKLLAKINKDLNDNSAMPKELKAKYVALRDEIDNIRSSMDGLNKVDFTRLEAEFQSLHEEMERTGKKGKNMVDQIFDAVKSQSVQFIAKFLSFQDIVGYVRQAINVIKELDYELIDLKKTTTMTADELKEFYYASNETAKQMGVTTKEIISQAANWSRLGYSSKEAATEMAALSSQFAQISPGMDVQTATDGLVSAMKAFHVDVTDVESEIMDVINKTGNTMATTNEEIVEMLKRSSAAMSAANNTIEETIALESAAVQITRNAETTGTAFRTISMRIRGYDEETEEYIGGVEELTGKVADLTKTAANTKGISLFTDETNTTYKSTYQILKDISEIYDELSDKQQAELLETLAGKRGGQVLAGILGEKNFKEVERAMDNMKKAAGSADAEMAIVEESIDYKINKLQQTWVGIVQELIDNGMLGQLIDALTSISEILGNIVTTVGPLPTIIAGLSIGDISKIGELLSGILGAGSETKIDTHALEGVGQIFNEVSEGAKGADSSVGSYAETLSNAGQIFHDISENAEAVSDVLDITDDISDMSEETQDVLGNISDLQDTFGEVTDTVEGTAEAVEKVGSYGSGLISIFGELVPILTNPLTIMAALAVATYALYKWVDGANDRQRKKIQEIKKEYNELNSQLESTISELENVQNQIDELQNKGPLTLVEKQELERLRTQAELLKIAKREQEELLKLKAQNLVAENKTHFNSVYGGTSSESINRIAEFEYDTGDLGFTHWDKIKSSLEGAAKGDYNDNPNVLLAIYKQTNKARQEALEIQKKLGSLSRELTEEEQDALDNAKTVLKDIDDNMSGLQINVGKAKTELWTMWQDATAAGTEEGKTLAKQASDILKVIYEASDTANEWNAMQIDSIFDNEKLEITRSELEALAQAGELKESTLEKYPELKKEIEGLDLILGEGETAWSLFKNEMKAAGSAASDVAKSIGEVDDALSSMYSISKLNDLESALNDVGTAMANIDEHGKFQLGDLDKIADYFIALENDEKKVAYETEAVSKALQLLGEGSGSVKENADAINTLVDNYIRTSKVLEGLNENNKELYETRLKMMGILNAETVVEEALAAAKAKNVDATLVERIAEEQLGEMKDALQNEDQETIDQIAEVINALMDEAEANDNTRKAVEYLVKVQEIFSNQDLSVNEKITQLEKLANAYLETAEAAELTAKIQALQESKKYLRGAGMTAEIKAAEEAKIDAEIQRLMNEGIASLKNFEKVKYTRAEYSGGTPLKNKLGKESSSTEEALANATKKAAEDAAKAAYDAEHAYKQVIDYFERMVKVIDNSISLLEAHLEDVVGSFAKNKLLDAEEDLIQSKLNSYSSAVDMYSKKAEESLSKIPSDIAEKLINGAVDIDEFISQSDQEVVDAIQDYQNWADKVADARLQLVQLKETLRQLELKKFQNVMKDFNDQIDLRQSSGIDLISKQIALLQEAGEIVGQSYYEKQKELTEKQLQTLDSEKEALVNQMNEALSRGVDKGSDEWLEMVKALTEIEGKIIDAKKALEEFDNAILALHTEIFNRIQDQFASYASELSNMEALFDDESMPVADEKGEWTKEGLTRLGLLAQQYELAQEQTRMFGEEIEKLNQDYLDGKYSATEYADRLAELKEQQWDSVNAAEAAKKSMVALNKARVELQIEGINKEIEAYEKLIQAQKDALSAEKDLHDYQKSIAESEKSIVALQKQLAAIANDDSAAARAKRLKLQEQLNEKLEELDEKQYDHSVEQQQESLDEQLEQYKENRELEIEELKNSLLEIETLLNESFETVRENSELIGNEIIKKAQEHGIEMSECLTDAWFQGENAIGHYSETLGEGTSNFIQNIREVENNIWELQDQANVISDELAEMFATRADNLVDELTRSYDSEENLNAMTEALHDSLTSTIDGSYSGTKAKSALDGITNAADELKQSAEEARKALEDLLKTKNEEAETPERKKRILWSGSDYNTALAQAAWYGYDESHIQKVGSQWQVWGYAKGTKRVTSDQLAWTQENGPEMIISPASGAVLTPLKSGDAVIPAHLTENLWKWGSFNPEEFASKLLSSGKVPNTGNVNANTMQIGSVVTITGPVNDTVEMVKIASQQATAKIQQSWHDLSNTLHG